MEIVIERGKGCVASVLMLRFPSWRRKMETDWICSSETETKQNGIFEKIK